MADMLRRSLIDRTTKKKSPKGWFLFCVCILPLSLAFGSTEGVYRGYSCLRQPLSKWLNRAQVGTRSPYSLPFVILPVPARSPFRFIRHRRRSTPYPFAERSFQWGYGGVQGGLRGESEIFPGPLAKKDYKVAYSSLFNSLSLAYGSTPPSTGRLWGAFYQLFPCNSALPRRYAGKLLPSSHFHDIFES